MTFTHYVQCKFAGDWAILTKCESLAQAKAILAYWRERTSYTLRIKRA